MKTTEEIIKRLRALMSLKSATIQCTVVSVDKDAATCIVDDNGLEYENVRLTAVVDTIDAFSFISPAIGSWVLISFLNGSDTDAFVSSYSEIEEVLVKAKIINLDGLEELNINSTAITLNGGDNKGLAKVDGLKSRLNTIENSINSLKQAFTAWTPTAYDGGAALKAATASWAGVKLQQTALADIENDKIKH